MNKVFRVQIKVVFFASKDQTKTKTTTDATKLKQMIADSFIYSSIINST